MWISFGLVAIALYFAESMTYELRASDNRVAGEEAEEVIEGARRYLTCVLSNLNQPGVMPDPQSYLKEGVPVGTGKFWIIGRTNVENQLNLKTPTFGLIDEASKLNLNSSFLTTNFAMLPRMTADLANNILTWRTTNTGVAAGGADSSTYMSMQPPYLCKAAPFETVDELRLVYNLNIDILYGEDANMNGILDANENDGDALPPSDNMDGRLDAGLFEYVTIYTHEPTTQSNGQARVNLTTAATLATQLATLLQGVLGDSRASQILLQAGLAPTGQQGQRGPPGGGNTVTITSPLHLFMVSGMTPAEFNQVEGSVMGANTKGLINVNTASSIVLSCLPGMDIAKAEQLVSYRQSNQSNQDYRNSVCWVSQVLDPATCLAVGPYITGRTYQFMADIVAVGHGDRGYRRTRFVFDTSSGTPIIVYRQDLTHLGWALGKLDTKPNSLFTAK
jgi:type II secretory pathway component PulK